MNDCPMPCDEHYCRVDYMINGKWYFRKFSSKSRAFDWLRKMGIKTFTTRDCDGSLLGG